MFPMSQISIFLLAPTNRLDEAFQAAESFKYDPHILRHVRFEGGRVELVLLMELLIG